MKEHEITYPVILLGVDRKEHLGFKELKVVCEGEGGEVVFTSYLDGVISLQMINDTLVVYVKKEKD